MKFARHSYVSITLLVCVLTMAPLSIRSQPVAVGGPFTLETADGSTVTDATYRGHWLLVYFGYTSCPDSCPTALVAITTALKALGPDADKIRPLFISVDPQRDTPEVIGRYVGSFDSRIVGLTGTQKQIDGVTQAYGAYVAARPAPTGGLPLFDHSIYIYLMSPQGTFVRAFDTDWSGARIAAAVREAIGTGKRGGGA
jgi:protein SCO1/2